MIVQNANQSVEPTGARHSGYDATGNLTAFLSGESPPPAPVAHFTSEGISQEKRVNYFA